MSGFKALVVRKTESGQAYAFETLQDADLMPGDVTIDVAYSSVNYKDGLAVTGKAPIIRNFPLIPGIDLAGTVTSSTHPLWKAGDKIVLGGWGVGESHSGGFGERYPGDHPGRVFVKLCKCDSESGYNIELFLIRYRL